MRIDYAEGARQFAAEWIACSSPERAGRVIQHALDGLHTVRSIVQSERYSDDTREDVRGAIVALVAALTRLEAA